MEIARWDPEKPLGREGAEAHADPHIYTRLTVPRETESRRPEDLDAALEHCSKQFLVRDLHRDVTDPGGILLDREQWREPGDYRIERARPDVKPLSAEMAKVQLASRAARRTYRAARAMWRVLLRKPVW